MDFSAVLADVARIERDPLPMGAAIRATEMARFGAGRQRAALFTPRRLVQQTVVVRRRVGVPVAVQCRQ